jgi:hypothetical protein
MSFFIVAKLDVSTLFEDRSTRIYRLQPTLLRFSCYRCAPKAHGTFKCDRCAPKHVISCYKCTTQKKFEASQIIFLIMA